MYDLNIDNHLDVIVHMSENLYKLGYIDEIMKKSYIEYKNNCNNT